jgi:peptidoglycan-associated lipoprotein
MMKKTILFCVAFLLVTGCAKKQILKPTPQPAVEQQEETGDETDVRFTDWTTVPEIGNVYFEFDSFSLSPESTGVLKKNAEYLLSDTSKVVLVEGHCDERGTIEYNLALGQKRAATIREYYGKLGVSVARIGTISYGSEKPVDQGHNEAAWARNRRGETKIRNK